MDTDFFRDNEFIRIPHFLAKNYFFLNIAMNSSRENKNANMMQPTVKMCDFSVFFFSLMRKNGLLKDLPNILEKVLYSACNKTEVIKIFYVQT